MYDYEFFIFFLQLSACFHFQDVVQHGTNELCKISLLVYSGERDRVADGRCNCLVAVLEILLMESDCTSMFCFAIQITDRQ